MRDVDPQAHPPLQQAWSRLGESLLSQRVLLHLADYQRALDAPPDQINGLHSSRALSYAVLVYPPCITEAVSSAGLGTFLTMAARHADATAPANPLLDATAAAAAEVGSRAPVLAAPLEQFAHASAWWVGFFGLLRHEGVHHLTHEPLSAPIGLRVLREAARAVCLGVSLRFMGALLRSGQGEAAVREAYARATVAVIGVERDMPLLHHDLGELRLVDLVALTVPWRGRFEKFRGGAGPGQVE